jgi:hypothetical protein
MDKSNSMLSNGDIWAESKSPDDSKQFIENFYDINQKKSSQFKDKCIKDKVCIDVNIIGPE